MKPAHTVAVSLLIPILVAMAPALVQAADKETGILSAMVADSDPEVARVRDALTSFHGKHGRWPSDMPELMAFATKFGRPIDTTAFATTTYGVSDANGGTAAFFEYTLVGSGATGAFAVTFNAIQ